MDTDKSFPSDEKTEKAAPVSPYADTNTVFKASTGDYRLSRPKQRVQEDDCVVCRSMN